MAYGLKSPNLTRRRRGVAAKLQILSLSSTGNSVNWGKEVCNDGLGVAGLGVCELKLGECRALGRMGARATRPNSSQSMIDAVMLQR